MNISWYASCFRCSCGVFALATAGLLAPAATAQLTPDNTLGSEQSIVNENVQVRGDFADQIDGGAIRGSNLFHSFSEFNVNEQQRVYFANPAGIETILNRVTGNDVSDIMGTLGVDGGANLFLLNPNGIIFGENAQLDISGSFTASTADAIVFPDGGAFSAINPGDTSLLTVGVPLGVQYGPGAQGDITNAGNLAVGAGQEMTLYGDTVRSSGSLTTSGGLVQALGNRVALTDSARIDVASETGGGTVLVGGEYRGEGPVPNALRTYVGPDVVINADAVNNGDGGRVIVWADEATGFYGNISARGGSLAGDGGFVEVSGKQSLAFDGLVDVGAVAGQAGQLLLDPENVIIVEQAPGVNDGELNDNEILFGDEPGSEFIISGNAIRDALNNADVTIEAEDTIRSDETVVISSGASNSLTLNASEIILTAPIINLGGGDMGGGAINLESTNGSINIVDAGGVFIRSSGGAINLESTNGSINIVDVRGNFTIDSSGGAINLESTNGSINIVDAGGVSIDSSGGDINLESTNGSINIEGDISFDSSQDEGSAGDIFFGASEDIRLIGGDRCNTGCTIIADLRGGEGTAGDITLESGGDIRIEGTTEERGGFFQINSSTSAIGDAGDILITAEGAVTIAGFIEGGGGFSYTPFSSESPTPSAILSLVLRGGEGNGGDVTIDADSLILSNGGQINSFIDDRPPASDLSPQDSPRGIGGDIDLNITNDIQIIGSSDPAAPITGIYTTLGNGARTGSGLGDATGLGGSIVIDSGSLLIEANSDAPSIFEEGGNAGIAAKTFSQGNAGSINIITSDELRIVDGGFLDNSTAPTFIDGEVVERNVTSDAGSIIIKSDSITLIDENQDRPAIQSASLEGSDYSAGDIEITTNSLHMSQSSLDVSTRGNSGGNIRIFGHSPSFLLFMQNGSRISAEAFGEAAGGNVFINDDTVFDSNNNVVRNNTLSPTGFILATQEDNDIIAKAEENRGGNIRINAYGIFGLEERDPLTDLSDINASSEIGLDGEIVLNTLNIDPTRGLGELPLEIVDASDLVAEGCVGSDRSGVDQQGEFRRTGRGGISPNPTGVLTDESLLDQAAVPNEDNQAEPPSTSAVDAETLVEAQGLGRNANGKVSLVSADTAPSVSSPALLPNFCNVP